MARTTFSGPVKSDNGFEGSFIGTLAITESGNTITTTRRDEPYQGDKR